MIKNIIFDMGGVIVDWNPERSISKWNLSEEDSKLLLNKTFNDFRWSLLDFGYYANDDEYLKDVLPEIPERLHKVTEKIVKDWASNFSNFVDGVPELIKELKDRGFNLYLLSNAGPSHKDYFHVVRSHDCFDGVVVSADVKQYKPCPDIFRTLLNRYNLDPKECLFIDDLTNNCAAAFLCGIQPIVFRNCVQLREDLKKYIN